MNDVKSMRHSMPNGSGAMAAHGYCAQSSMRCGGAFSEILGGRHCSERLIGEFAAFHPRPWSRPCDMARTASSPFWVCVVRSGICRLTLPFLGGRKRRRRHAFLAVVPAEFACVFHEPERGHHPLGMDVDDLYMMSDFGFMEWALPMRDIVSQTMRAEHAGDQNAHHHSGNLHVV